MTWASILKVVLPYLVGAILGAVIYYSVMPEPEVPEPYLVIKYDTTIVVLRDTIRLKPQTIIKTIADTILITPDGNVKSQYKGEADGVQVIADIYSPCYIDSVIFDFTFDPIIIEREKMVVSSDTIRTITVFVKPPWHKTWLVGFVEGVVLVAGSVYLAGQL